MTPDEITQLTELIGGWRERAAELDSQARRLGLTWAGKIAAHEAGEIRRCISDLLQVLGRDR